MRCNYKGGNDTTKCEKCGRKARRNGRGITCTKCGHIKYEEESLIEKKFWAMDYVAPTHKWGGHY